MAIEEVGKRLMRVIFKSEKRNPHRP